MTKATRNPLGTSLVTLLLGLHFGFFAGHFRHLWFWTISVSDYETQSIAIAVLTVALLLAEAFVPIFSKQRYRVLRHSGLFVLGVAQLIVFFNSVQIYQDFCGVFLGIPTLALYALLAISDKAQIFSIERDVSLPTYVDPSLVVPSYRTPSPGMAEQAPPAYYASLPVKN